MLGDNIKRAMKNKNILAKDLANAIGITPTYLSYILNNKRKNPSMELLNNIASFFNVPVDTFFDDNPNSSSDDKSSSLVELEKDLPIIPKEFINPNDAREYVNKHQIFGSNGFDADKLDDNEILEFANELLKQMELISFKFKK